MKAFLLTTIAFLAFTITCKAQWTLPDALNNINNSNTNNVGIGTTTPNAKLETQATTEQLRLSYDPTHFASFTTSSAGNLGVQAGIITFNLSQYLNIKSSGNTGLILDAPTGSGSFARIRTGTTGSISDFSINAGTGSTNNLRFVNNQSTNTIMTLSSNDYVGIGTTSPLANLQVQTNTNAPTFTSIVNNDPGASAKALISVGSTPGTGGTFGSFEYLGSGRTATGLLGADRTMLRGNGVGGLFVTAENAAGVIAFATGGTSSANERVRIDASGNVGIGTRFPDAKLAVQGTIHSTSVLVDTNVPPPDYVFKDGYNLPTLAEVKAYTDKNHHLPEVPAAAEFEKNGINLGEMNMVLLKKVEELTLYLIELNKKVSAQQKELEQLKNKE